MIGPLAGATPSPSTPVTPMAITASSEASPAGTGGSPGPILPRSSATRGPSSR